MVKTSVVMTTFNRAPLLEKTLQSIYWQEYKDFEVIVVDDGFDEETSQLCAQWPVRYFKVHRPPSTSYRNPAWPNNVGIRQAVGDVIILQNAECRHDSPEVMFNLTEDAQDGVAAFARVEALYNTGNHCMWYVHSEYNPRPFFFCGALKRKTFEQLRGFDEDYVYYGADDNDFADRLAKSGVSFMFDDEIHVQHQWHPSSFNVNDTNNHTNGVLYQQKTQDMANGIIGVERNLGREWGDINAYIGKGI